LRPGGSPAFAANLCCGTHPVRGHASDMDGVCNRRDCIAKTLSTLSPTTTCKIHKRSAQWKYQSLMIPVTVGWAAASANLVTLNNANKDQTTRNNGEPMKKLLTVLCATCALSLSLQAGEGKKCEMTDEQKAVCKEFVTKYDANQDGKLDKEEKAKISAEDKATLEKAGLGDVCKEKCAKSEACH
jgi:hypothetical protein